MGSDPLAHSNFLGTHFARGAAYLRVQTTAQTYREVWLAGRLLYCRFKGWYGVTKAPKGTKKANLTKFPVYGGVGVTGLPNWRACQLTTGRGDGKEGKEAYMGSGRSLIEFPKNSEVMKNRVFRGLRRGHASG